MSSFWIKKDPRESLHHFLRGGGGHCVFCVVVDFDWLDSSNLATSAVE